MRTLLSPIGVLFMWFLIFHFADGDDILLGKACNGSTEGNNDLENAIVTTLNKLTTVDSSTGFNMQSLISNAGSHTVYGLAQCRGDAINTDQCAKCLQQAETALYAECKKKTRAVILFDLCFIRFDVNNFFGSWTIDSEQEVVKNVANAGNPFAFIPVVATLLTSLKLSSEISMENHFSKKTIKTVEGVIIYGMAQCTQDLHATDCVACLSYLQSVLLSQCGSALGCNIYRTSCFFRYETYNFFLS